MAAPIDRTGPEAQNEDEERRVVAERAQNKAFRSRAEPAGDEKLEQ